jgi:ferrous iron transport protein B
MGRKWALAVVLWQCALAWLAALVVYWIGMALF